LPRPASGVGGATARAFVGELVLKLRPRAGGRGAGAFAASSISTTRLATAADEGVLLKCACVGGRASGFLGTVTGFWGTAMMIL